MNRLLTFWVSVPNDDVVFQAIPTLLSGLTVRASRSCSTAGMVEVEPCPYDPSEENSTRSTKPDARTPVTLLFEVFNAVT